MATLTDVPHGTDWRDEPVDQGVPAAPAETDGWRDEPVIQDMAPASVASADGWRDEPVDQGVPAAPVADGWRDEPVNQGAPAAPAQTPLPGIEPKRAEDLLDRVMRTNPDAANDALRIHEGNRAAANKYLMDQLGSPLPDEMSPAARAEWDAWVRGEVPGTPVPSTPVPAPTGSAPANDVPSISMPYDVNAALNEMPRYIGDTQEPEKVRPTEGVVASALGGLAKGGTGLIQSAGNAALDVAGQVLQKNADVYENVARNVRGEVANLARLTGMAYRAAGEQLSDWAAVSKKYYDAQMAYLNQKFPSGDITQDPGIMLEPSWWADQIGNGLTSISNASLGVGGAAPAQIAARMAVAGGILEGAPSYQEMRGKGYDFSNAAGRAALYGTASALLNKISLNKILKPEALGVGRRVLVSMATEGTTEWAEEPTQYFIENVGRENLTEFGAGIMDAMRQGINVLPQAMLGGGAMSAAHNAGEIDQNVRQKARDIYHSLPKKITLADAELLLVKRYGREKVTHLGPDLLLLTMDNGKVLALKFSEAQGTATTNPEAVLDSVMGQAPAEAQAALAATGGDRTLAGRLLVVEGWRIAGAESTGATVVNPRTGENIAVDTLISLADNMATAGTLDHEITHALATLAGMRVMGGNIVDPMTGQVMPEEEVAWSIEHQVDHPVVSRITDMINGVANAFRTTPRPTGAQVARTVQAKANDLAGALEEQDKVDAAEAINQDAKASGENQADPVVKPEDIISVSTPDSAPLAVDAERGVATQRYSLRSFKDEQKRGVYTQWEKEIVDAGIATPEDARKFIKDITSVAALIIKNKDVLDYDATDEFEAVKENGDPQYKWSEDYTTICRKTQKLLSTISEIMVKNKKGLTADQIIQVRDDMRKSGDVVNCAVCYVFSRWMGMGKYMDQLAEQYPEIPKELIYDPRRGAELKAQYPEAWKARTGHGSSGGKAIETRTEFKSGIVKAHFNKKQISVQNLFSGMRLQSWSDFDILHVIDLMQATAERAKIGLKAQSYTKVPDFVRLMAQTMAMINISLIAKGSGFDANGKLLFDAVEGMDPKVAFELRQRYNKTTGTIVVGISDRHIRALMADSRIDYIIPYHASGMSKRLLSTMVEGWDDYTKTQNDKIIDRQKYDARIKRLMETTRMTKAQAKKIMPWEWWDPAKTPEQNGKNFLKYCADNGVAPRFEQFSKDKGYWKLLIDRRMVDANGKYIEQQPTRASFDMVEVNKMLRKYLAQDQLKIDDMPNTDVVKKWTGDKRLSVRKVTPEQDAEYMAAAQAGDIEKAQRMVDEAAGIKNRYAGLEDEYIDSEIIEPPHEVRDSKKLDKLITHMSLAGWVGRPILAVKSGDLNVSMTGSHRIAAAKKAKIDIPVIWLDQDKLDAWIEKDDRNYDRFFNREGFVRLDDSSGETIRMLREIGDRQAVGLYADELRNNELEDIAISDPVTRDSEGNIIPLSKRFNPESSDIRYSVRPITKEKVIGDIENRMNEIRQSGEDIRSQMERRPTEKVKRYETFAKGRATISGAIHLLSNVSGSEARKTMRSSMALAVNEIRKALPVRERGRWLTIGKLRMMDDPAKIIVFLNELDRHMEEVQRKDLVAEIKKTFKRAVESPSVHVDYAKRIKALVNHLLFQKPSPATMAHVRATAAYINAALLRGEDVEMPQKILDALQRIQKKALIDMEVPELQMLLEQIVQFEQLGRLKYASKKAQIAAQKAKELDELSKDTVAMNNAEPVKVGIGEAMTPGQWVTSAYRKAWDGLKNTGRDIMPTTVLMQMLDGYKGQMGANYRIFKARINLAWNKYLTMMRPIEIELKQKLIEYGITKRESERIGVYAALQQKGGRDKLHNNGYTDMELDELTLTAKEIAFYQWMRQKLDEMRPEIAQTMRDVDNKDMDYVENYFPFQTDWQLMDEELMGGYIRDDNGVLIKVEEHPRFKSNVEKGFTKGRTGAGKQKIKVDSVHTFLKHIGDASYYVAMGRQISYLQSIAKSDEYRAIAGDSGSLRVKEWLDTMARKGGLGGAHTIRWVDTIRRNVGMGMLGFRLSSIAIQPTSMLDAVGLIGHWAGKGAFDIAGSRDWRKFVLDNFPEVAARVGDDPSYLEFGNGWTLKKLREAGYWPMQKMDMLAAASIAAGAYQKYMREHNLPIDLTRPNKDAIVAAQYIVERTQGSGVFKDVPLMVSRGKLFGSRSFTKAFLQFQTFALNKFSLITHEGIRDAIANGKPMQAFNVLLWCNMAFMAEEAIRLGLRKLRGTGDDDDDETYWKNVAMDSVQIVPFLGQGLQTIHYSSVPAPAIDQAVQVVEGTKSLITGKAAQTKAKGAIKAAGAAGSVFGIPGAGQVSQTVADTFFKDIDKKSKSIVDKYAKRFNKDVPPTRGMFRMAERQSFAEARMQGLVKTVDEKGRRISLDDQRTRWSAKWSAAVERRYGSDVWERIKKRYHNEE